MNFTFIIYVSHFIIVKSVIFGHFAIEFRRKSHENRHITIEHNQKGTMSITPFVSRYAQRTHTPRRGNNKQVACMLHVSARLCVRCASERASDHTACNVHETKRDVWLCVVALPATARSLFFCAYGKMLDNWKGLSALGHFIYASMRPSARRVLAKAVYINIYQSVSIGFLWQPVQQTLRIRIANGTIE